MADRYSTNNKGLAPALSEIMLDYAKAPRSPFDKSSKKGFDMFPFAIIPFDLVKCLPNTDVNLSYDIQIINKNPTIRRMLGSMRLETRTYFVKDSDCWEGHNNFVTMGRSGTISKEIPRLRWRLAEGKTTCLPYNPYSMLNIAPPRYFGAVLDGDPQNPWSYKGNSGLKTISTELQDSGLTGISADKNEDETAYHDVNALPAVFYCKIAREYQNPNLLQNNPYWYPENENHSLILPYSLPNNADSVTNASYDSSTTLFGSGSYESEKNSIEPTNDYHSMPWLNVLYYAQRKGNYFNTGSPFPNLLRGDIPIYNILGATLDFLKSFSPNNNYGDNVLTDYSKFISSLNQDSSSNAISQLLAVDPNTNLLQSFFVDNDDGHPVLNMQGRNNGTNAILQALNKATITGIQFSMSQWRRLAVMTIFKEKMARTDGSYNQMIQTQFGINPKWHEHDPIYVGGSYQPIVFSEVTQTSGDSDTPLGTTAGKFVSASQNDRIHFHSDDFGMLMSVAVLTPDDYYCQGINRLWSSLSQADIPFPIMNNLDPQAILNKELYISGDNDVDNDVLAYAERYSEWKSDRNEISGLLQLPVNKIGDIGTFFFNRLLGSTPQFNWNFVRGDMTDNENLVFSSTEQAQFVLSVARQKHVTYPMPSISRPSDMGISYA